VKIFHTHSCKIPCGGSQPLIIYSPSLALLKPHDVTHVHGLTSYSCVLGSLFKKINHAKLVARSDLSQEGYDLLKNNAAWRSIFFKLFKSIDAVYAYTASEKAILLDLGFPEDAVWVVPLGIDLSRFYRRVTRHNAALAPTIGYIGRFDPVKGVHRLVEPLTRILREYVGAKVVFAGSRDDFQYADAILDRMGAFTNFSYLGPLAASDTPAFYYNCDIVLIPSLYDTGAIVALEAMASGVAIIASDIRPLNDYFKHEVSAILVKTEAEIYNACKRLIEDDALRAKLAAAAQKEATKYSGLTMIRKLEEIYANITDGRVGRSDVILKHKQQGE
jgi:glycosyltransferase involved in cell wall biosynthesis